MPLLLARASFFRGVSLGPVRVTGTSVTENKHFRLARNSQGATSLLRVRAQHCRLRVAVYVDRCSGAATCAAACVFFLFIPVMGTEWGV